MACNKAFLKWAGGKARIVEQIKEVLPEGNRLVEPFCGAGTLFLRTNYKKYLLCDINKDLINLFKIVQSDVDRYIEGAGKFFVSKNNSRSCYNAIREDFNKSSDNFDRSLMFLYLNKFGFNGLCRYNSTGYFNVPFGLKKDPVFPEKELLFFAKKAQYAEFLNISYEDCFKLVTKGDVVYCDPPYAPRENQEHKYSFTNYYAGGFSLKDQEKLASHAEEIANAGTSVVISNHATQFTKELYKNAMIKELEVRRSMSSNNIRIMSSELIAVFDKK